MTRMRSSAREETSDKKERDGRSVPIVDPDSGDSESESGSLSSSSCDSDSC